MQLTHLSSASEGWSIGTGGPGWVGSFLHCAILSKNTWVGETGGVWRGGEAVGRIVPLLCVDTPAHIMLNYFSEQIQLQIYLQLLLVNCISITCQYKTKGQLGRVQTGKM